MCQWGQVKLLFSYKLQVFEEQPMQTLNLFSDHAFDLSSKMSTVEKQSIALQYLTTETVNNIKDDIIARLCCLCYVDYMEGVLFDMHLCSSKIPMMCITQNLMSGGERKNIENMFFISLCFRKWGDEFIIVKRI